MHMFVIYILYTKRQTKIKSSHKAWESSVKAVHESSRNSKANVAIVIALGWLPELEGKIAIPIVKCTTHFRDRIWRTQAVTCPCGLGLLLFESSMEGV